MRVSAFTGRRAVTSAVARDNVRWRPPKPPSPPKPCPPVLSQREQTRCGLVLSELGFRVFGVFFKEFFDGSFNGFLPCSRDILLGEHF